MKRLFFAAFAFFMIIGLFLQGAHADEKTRSSLQSDLQTYKLREYNPQVNYERLIDITDSMLTKSDSFFETYSSNSDSNPVVFGAVKSLTAAQINSSTAFIEASASNAITLHSLSLNASGTAAGATSLIVQCSGGTDIAEFPIGMLVDDVPVGPYSSTGVGGATLSEELVNGCPEDEDIQIGNFGSSLTGSSHVIVNFTYTMQ